jgi:Flp pilus assembly protein TadG
MRNILENIFQNERGQGLILFAFAVVAMTGFTAMTVDVGLAYREKGNAQGAADAAALAAAGKLYAGGGNDAAEAEAVEIAAANGYVDGVDGITVDVNIPPASGHYAGQSSYAEVLISSSSSAQFATIFGINAFDINARAETTGSSR